MSDVSNTPKRHLRRWLPPMTINRLLVWQFILLAPYAAVCFLTPYTGPALLAWFCTWMVLRHWNRRAWKRHFQPRAFR